jgi:hypothetical protein
MNHNIRVQGPTSVGPLLHKLRQDLVLSTVADARRLSPMFDFEFDFCASWDVRCRRDYSSQTSSNLAIVDSLSILDLISSAELRRILMDLADQERGQPDQSRDLPPDHQCCPHAQAVERAQIRLGARGNPYSKPLTRTKSWK